MRNIKDNLAIEKTNATIIGMVCGSIIIAFLYLTYTQVLFKKFNLNTVIPYFLFCFLLGLCAVFFSKTTHIFNQRPKQGKDIIMTIIFFIGLIIFYAVVGISNWGAVFTLDLSNKLLVILIALSAGIVEELLCRNLLFNLFIKCFDNTKWVLIWASLSSSVIFGLIHLANLTHQTFMPTLQQIFYAFAFGNMLCFVHIFSNRMWPCILLHFLMDLQADVNQSVSVQPWGPLLLDYIPVIIISVLAICFYNRDLIKEY
ncbi:CPBP family intramembrane glutamic endopeptidase [Lactobacillus intestinalis]|uniref:Metal-dependent membrane protease n=1 Tax=Lactobacillus intestinalis DSM 6629 TaxID=1423761 RepID=A0ABR5PUL6_9LACO|nr:CPBP family intramembrane glutamic endopeptidase [Lactobacillus intestinalis]KRM34609.1 metal-dependent membrane protease [Lactobacillus intestinalis DSM 6629]UTW40342.1 CPBP family intramembrane metalloprotease [Lactobacillus intestinalis]